MQHAITIAIWCASGNAFAALAAWEARDAIRRWRRRHNIGIRTYTVPGRQP